MRSFTIHHLKCFTVSHSKHNDTFQAPTLSYATVILRCPHWTHTFVFTLNWIESWFVMMSRRECCKSQRKGTRRKPGETVRFYFVFCMTGEKLISQTFSPLKFFRYCQIYRPRNFPGAQQSLVVNNPFLIRWECLPKANIGGGDPMCVQTSYLDELMVNWTENLH